MNAKPKKRKTDSAVTAAGAIKKIKADITADDVARRAYARYCERGGRDGSDVNDWLEAERELRTAAASMAT